MFYNVIRWKFTQYFDVLVLQDPVFTEQPRQSNSTMTSRAFYLNILRKLQVEKLQLEAAQSRIQGALTWNAAKIQLMEQLMDQPLE